MKNFLLKETSDPKSRWILIDKHSPSGKNNIYQPLTDYSYWLEYYKGYPTNTVTQYVGHVARFIDFVYEASQIVDNPSITNLIHQYETYLLFGLDSEDEIVRRLAKSLGKTNKTSVSSIAQGIEAAISLFIRYRISKSENTETQDIFNTLFVSCYTRSNREIQNIKNKSWLEATIKNSLKESLPIGKEKLFSRSKKRASKSKTIKKLSHDKAFPLNRISELLCQEVKTNADQRNLTIISLLAASGVRTFEVLQIKISDIDFKNKRVYIRLPQQTSDLKIPEEKSRYLFSKGRVTEETFLIEPFASIFWHHLRKYISDVYRTNVKHDFLFQDEVGNPLFPWDRSNRSKEFKKYARNIGIPNATGMHSLRHSYGFYLLNYIPIINEDGNVTYGMPIGMVKILMGHASIESTEVYAVKDTDIIDIYVTHANNSIKGNHFSFKELQERVINNKIAQLEKLKGELYV